MTDYKKVFVDTTPFIYYLERNPNYFDKARNFFSQSMNEGVRLVTSAVTIEEYLVYPYSLGDELLENNFEEFLQIAGFEVASIDTQIAKRAARIRAEYKDFKGMDALQLATAIVNGCDLFLTNDKQLRQMKDVKVVMVEDWEDV